MKIYTSYYKKFENCTFNKIMVQVSNSKPQWFPWQIYNIAKVHPDWQLVAGLKNGTLTRDKYTIEYSKYLESLDRNTVLAELKELSDRHGGADIVLLCWENKSGFCHRHILAKWLDCDITEWEG